MTGKGTTKKHFHLPLLYFFSLSIGMIVLLSYLATGHYENFKSIYAQEPITSNFSLHEIDENEKVNVITQDEQINDNVAKKIDAYFEKNKAPLAGYGYIFTREARRNDIDPYIVAAIAQCESQGGKVTPQFGGIESYNAWGYAVFDNNNATRNMGAYGMGSFENGIALMSRVIKKYYNLGLIKPEEIVTRYTPASVKRAGGNPSEAPWTKCVVSTINKMDSQDIK